MIKRKKIQNILKKRPLILDGAMGTQLHKHGMLAKVCPEEWCIDNPKILESIHCDYIASGSDVVYSATFGANEYKLKQYGLKDVYGINKKLAQIARRACGKDTLVAGDIGPTGKFIHPFGPVAFEDAVSVFKEQVRGLVAGGVDLFVIETMMDIQEARAALLAVKEEAPGYFVMVAMTYEQDGRTLNGTDPVSALVTLQSLGADAVGCNCSCGPKEMLKLIKQMQPFAKVPLVAKPNAGMPRLVNGRTVFDMDSKTFAKFAKQFIAAGVGALGGCCGTTPEHIKELKKKVKGLKAAQPKEKALAAVSSARKTVVFERCKKPFIVGECINPTGKKELARQLKENDFSLTRTFAREQAASGADILDVNVGVPEVDQLALMNSIVELLSKASDLPLSIDSSKPEVIEAALRVYPGRALVNSLSAERGKVKKLLPVIAKYGAMLILLPLTDKELPHTAAKRKIIIASLLKKVIKAGLSKEDVLVDCLVMTASSDPKAPSETAKTVSWCTSKGLKTIAGLSNVSFGLPQRKIINNTFLLLLMKKGLVAAIADPRHIDYKRNALAEKVLLNKDKDAKKYVNHFSKIKESVVSSKKLSPVEAVSRAVIEGDREGIGSYIDTLLSSGYNPQSIITEVMIPAITTVGELFDKKKYFLPQLIASAEAMQKGFIHLKPHLKDHKKLTKKIVILLATVEGDIHDIGKNIVNLMLRNHGFEVIDLGKDVSVQRIVREIKKYKPALVGLSALMTTTMVNIEPIINTVRKEGLKCKFFIGGAVVSSSFANKVNASYAKDGVEAVKVAKKLTS